MMPILAWAKTEPAIRAAAAIVRRILGAFINCILERTLIADAELETATASILRIARDRNPVIQPQGAEMRNIQAQAKSVIVVIQLVELVLHAKTIRVHVNH